MPAKPIAHQITPKHEYQVYLKKALEFYSTMQDCFIAGKWNSCALSAVHAAISANDALMVFMRGIKCSSSRHEDSATLLQGIMELKDVKTYAMHLLRVIKKKNAVEYEGRHFSQKEAEDITRHAEHFINWVQTNLPK